MKDKVNVKWTFWTISDAEVQDALLNADFHQRRCQSEKRAGIDRTKLARRARDGVTRRADQARRLMPKVLPTGDGSHSLLRERALTNASNTLE